MNTKNKSQNLDNLRHSTSHLLAAAVLELYPEAKPAIGPSIENGFYYDIDFGDVKVSEEDFPKIEKKMHELIPSWKSFNRLSFSSSDAKKQYKKNPYKEELIEEFSEKGKKEVGFYESVGSKSSYFGGETYRDLCKGGHTEKPSEKIKYFKLLSVAGAYWRGNEKNKMLTRIYGTAWPTKEELDDYLKQLEEAKKRDHKKLGPKLDLFMFDETAPGSPYWLPNGMILLNELLSFWRGEHLKRGYKETSTPLINKKSLWETSGHWDHYKDNMFVSDMGENDIYGVKAMNCPNAMIIFGSKTRSYKDLPLRLSDADVLHRYEKSGELNGLFRVRMFRQDDSHNFISENEIENEFKEILKIAELFYGIFGLNYRLRLGTRPESFMGNAKTWDKAEKSLRKILEESDKEHFILEGDGAFYGPKIDILMRDSLNREWQMGTIQLDFQQPLRFKLKYTDSDGNEKTPVVVHRVIYGSIERFIGILIEHFGGAFPVWLSPVQVKILPISEKQLNYAKSVESKLKEAGVRVELDERSETLGAKIRNAQNEKVPYMAIVGQKEVDADKVTIRTREGKDLGQITIENFTKNVQNKIDIKSLEI